MTDQAAFDASAFDFAVHHSELPGRGLSLAYWREGVGGLPLLLVHGYPETKRIWARNVEPLVSAGFEVIVPDLRGYGDSDLAPDDHYDPACYGRDLHSLCHEVLGHETIMAAGGDVGGAVLSDLSARIPEFITRQAIFNTLAPVIAGVDYDHLPSEQAPFPTRDYFEEQGARSDELIEELDTPALRRRYVFAMYGHRLWGAPGGFTRSEIDWHTEPFADAQTLRAAMAVYELGTGKRPISELPVSADPNQTDTLILYGPEDHVVGPTFVDRMQIAFPNHRGPFHIPGAGHFLQWEQPRVLESALIMLAADLLAAHGEQR